MSEQKRYIGNIIIVGSTYAGKTSWIKRLNGEDYNQFSPTITAVTTQHTTIFDKGEYTFKIWDTAGQQGKNEILTILNEDIDVMIIFVNLSHKVDINAEMTYYLRLLSEVKGEENDILKVIIGNRIDEAFEEMPVIVARAANQM